MNYCHLQRLHMDFVGKNRKNSIGKKINTLVFLILDMIFKIIRCNSSQ